ncbi:MAG: hypothetical protein KAV82_12905 [Phycisphaerae bacterium]|nr:hypothetical protein [Phycisphaerae bacterium]
MADLLHHQLLSQARRLARLDPKRPRQGNLRRTVSSAYYALFHYPIDQATRVTLGTSNDRRPYRDFLARSFEHGSMSKACRSFAGGTLPRTILRALPSTFSIHACPSGIDSIEDNNTGGPDRTRDMAKRKFQIDEELIEAYRGTVSLPFDPGDHKRVTVKIIDDRGIESLKIVEIT